MRQDESMSDISFPRQNARTRRFSLGVPRSFVISPDGQRVIFLRSRNGTDPLTNVYELDVSTGAERLIVDAALLLGDGGDEIPPDELARRERSREAAGGVVRFHADASASTVVFDLSGRLYIVDVVSASIRALAARGPVVDPRLSPSGAHVAYVAAGALRVIEADGSRDRLVIGPQTAGPGGAPSIGAGPVAGGEDTGGEDAGESNITYGLAEFVAGEEMDRTEGYWWSPNSTQLLVERVDISGVSRRYIGDPSSPSTVPTVRAYPAAGTANALVELHLATVDGVQATSGAVDADGAGTTVRVQWDTSTFEYITTVVWSDHGLLMVVATRNQQRMQVLEVDPSSGATSLVREDRDPMWLDVVSGVPGRLSDGSLVWSADRDDARRLIIGDEAVTPEAMQLRSVLAIDGDVVLFSASTEPTETRVWTWSRADGLSHVPAGDAPGVATGWRNGGTTVLASRHLERSGVAVSVHRDSREVAQITSLSETPVVTPRPLIRRTGERQLRTAVLFPTGHEPGAGTLPVLLDPYGGPHFQRVTAASGAFLESQWFADQGYCVIVADGRGTPGRGSAWDRSVYGDLATAALEDQVAALHAVADEFEDLDLSRVAIRGWSFGGYLAALALLRRPDVFHAAVAGAPVTEWHLYDTFYTERYLGHPSEEPGNYERSSLLGDAARLERPLLLIHGLADDNVAAANTLLLSSALLAAGRPHNVLPLSGVTHMTPQEDVAENLLLLQLEFLRTALATPAEMAS
jgi:dipeptidyl-peptidase-4